MAIINRMLRPTKPSVPYIQLILSFNTMIKTIGTKKSVATSFQIRKKLEVKAGVIFNILSDTLILYKNKISFGYHELSKVK